jgi:hypothetical protein
MGEAGRLRGNLVASRSWRGAVVCGLHLPPPAFYAAGRRDVGMRTVAITDNGRGGADPANGSGLAGLARRVQEAEGTLTVTSLPGGPIIVVAELPCVS